MSASEVLRLARETGVRVGASGADLILDAEREPPPTVLESLRRHKAGIIALLAADRDSWTAEDWHAFFFERAGIAEYDGRQTRAEAEAIAFECCVVEWLNRNPRRSDAGQCAWCQEPDLDGHTVVPFGTADHGHAWLHPGCWNDWHQRRREQAQRCLAGIGVKVPSGTSERIEFPENSMKSGAGRQAKFFNEQKAK